MANEAAAGPKRRLPVGAEITAAGAHFRVWAPKARRVELVLMADSSSTNKGRRIELRAEGNGYYSAIAADATAGMFYGYVLDGHDPVCPDPASRFQPTGLSGLSQIVDSKAFAWTDQSWQGLRSAGQVIYEMHVGTFTPEGSWVAAARELPELARIGITIVEVMPVAEFPGQFGWGYDGVLMFAPTRLYGGPDDFRKFVNAAHAAGLGVILDVVYNHFGSFDNCVSQFSDHYKSDRYENEWADAINFDGENSTPVREYFLANARHWIEEYHLDGFRFDATQSIFDASREHILTAVTRAARDSAGQRPIFMAAENEPQDVRTVRPADEDGHGMNAVWNDDFHHSAMVRVTDTNPAYYSDYLGTVEELIAAIKRGFLYQGQCSQWQKKPRGTPTTGLPATAFVTFLQNHDQIANSATGERIQKLTSPGRFRAITAMFLLAPQTPLLFQGQEFAASTPFLYFADYSGEAGAAVAKGRAQFMSQFPNLATAEDQRRLSDPIDRRTFERCKLDLSQRQSNQAAYDLHIDLLRLRREDPVFSRQRADRLDAAALGPDCLMVRFFADDDDRLLLVNFGRDLRFSPSPQPLLAPPLGRGWETIWHSDSPRYGGTGTSPIETDEGWLVPGEAAVVMRAVGRKANSPATTDK